MLSPKIAKWFRSIPKAQRLAMMDMWANLELPSVDEFLQEMFIIDKSSDRLE